MSERDETQDPPRDEVSEAPEVPEDEPDQERERPPEAAEEPSADEMPPDEGPEDEPPDSAPPEVTDSEEPGEPEEPMAPYEGPPVDVNELSRWFGPVIAVNKVTTTIDQGITGLLGPNGSGKTTLMRMIMGLIRPSSGRIEVLGENPWNNPRLLARIGYVGDGDAPWRDRTGIEATRLAAQFAGVPADEVEQRCLETLEAVGLTDAMDRVVAGYSRGMRQRLKFALALLRRPELYILDEPLLGTDPTTRMDLLRLIKDLVADGASVLVSTHVLHDVEALTDRILLLHKGRLMAHGRVHEIRDLLEKYPRTVRITTPEPRELGGLLWQWENVASVEIDEGAVNVRTRDPQPFFEALHDLFSREDVPFTSITSPDDNLESVFRFLTE